MQLSVEDQIAQIDAVLGVDAAAGDAAPLPRQYSPKGEDYGDFDLGEADDGMGEMPARRPRRRVPVLDLGGDAGGDPAPLDSRRSLAGERRRKRAKDVLTRTHDDELDEEGMLSRRSDVSAGGRSLKPARRGGRRERADSRGSLAEDGAGSPTSVAGDDTRRSKMQKYIQEKLKKKGVVEA